MNMKLERLRELQNGFSDNAEVTIHVLGEKFHVKSVEIDKDSPNGIMIVAGEESAKEPEVQ